MNRSKAQAALDFYEYHVQGLNSQYVIEKERHLDELKKDNGKMANEVLVTLVGGKEMIPDPVTGQGDNQMPENNFGFPNNTIHQCNQCIEKDKEISRLQSQLELVSPSNGHALVFDQQCRYFWLSAFIQHLFTILWWQHKKVVIEAPKYLDNETNREYFCWNFSKTIERITKEHNIMYGVKMIFDETVWLPAEPNSYMNRALVCLSYGLSADSYLFLLDFTKPIRQGVYLCSQGSLSNTIPVNIFDVSFREVFSN